MVPDGEWTQQEEEYWENRIQRIGGVRAYKEFGEEVAKGPISAQHGEAHGFGRALYEAGGAEGASACDMQFSMGCYHEFIGQAIAGQGQSVTRQLVAVCDNLPTPVDQSGCRHGIGHGIQAWLGYKPKNLLEGLALCKEIQGAFNDPYGGCASGLYMEYNLRLMTIPNSALRDVENDNYLAPCDIVPKDDESSCVFWLPQWRLSGLRLHSPIVSNKEYQALGVFCRSLGLNESLTDDCFRGVGATVYGTATSTLSAREGCDSASSTRREQTICRGFVAALNMSEQHENLEEVCVGLSGPSYIYCEDYTTGKSTVFDVIPLSI